MTHQQWNVTGRRFAQAWGSDDNGDLKDYMARMNPDARAVCIMAAVLRELQDIRHELIKLQMDVTDHKDNPKPADGMLQWMAISMGDKPISYLDRRSLSPRARKALIKARVTLISQVNEQRFHGIQNCGPMTTRELLEWAGKHRGTDASDSDEFLKYVPPKPAVDGSRCKAWHSNDLKTLNRFVRAESIDGAWGGLSQIQRQVVAKDLGRTVNGCRDQWRKLKGLRK